ncbi:MAG: type IV pilus assembly protein PilM [Actinomycetes bacterium]
MARRVIGLDVGTHAVRVAEVELEDPPRVTAFGQVALPYDAMREGEIVDATAVTKAVQRLWSELGLGKGEVRLGIASPRVIVRTVEVPVMADADLEGALRFQAGDLLPIPLDEAAFDFQVLESVAAAPGATGDDGEPAEPTQRVLIAAAPRITVEALADAVRAAGVRPAAVDIVPLALVRALGRRVGTNGPAAETLVSVGSGTTVIVVQESGLPRFVRIVGGGGRAVTAAVEAALGVATDEAETIKREPSADPTVAAQVDAAIAQPLRDIVEAVRGSVDFYRGQPDALPVVRITLTGGGSLQHGLAEAIGEAVDLPCVAAQPRSLITLGDIGFGPDEVPQLDPYLAVPVGLALAGLAPGRRINLLGDQGSTLDRRTLATIGAAVGGGLLLVLGLLTLLANGQLSDARDARDEAQARNAALEAEAAKYADAQAQAATVEGLRTQAETVLATDVSWARMLQEIARTIPNDSWLTTFQGSVATAETSSTVAPGTTTIAGAPGVATTPAAGTKIGTASFGATGLDFTSVASWIQRIGEIPSFTNLWVPNATKDSSSATSRSLVTYSSTADITTSAISERAAEFGGDR